eukprot:5515915-Amphidinium_carterae.1
MHQHHDPNHYRNEFNASQTFRSLNNSTITGNALSTTQVVLGNVCGEAQSHLLAGPWQQGSNWPVRDWHLTSTLAVLCRTVGSKGKGLSNHQRCETLEPFPGSQPPAPKR